MPPAPDTVAAKSTFEPQRLVLAYARPPATTGVLDWLARRLDLDTYGDSLLTRGAGGGLRMQAGLLAIVFLFDAAIWTVMFNMLFGMGYLRLGWHSGLALAAALVMALVMFFWERSIATLDVHGGIGTTTRLGIGARVAIVTVAALAMALPLELVLFKDEIQQRAFEEAVRHEFVVQLQEHRDIEDEIKTLAGAKDELSQRGPSAADLDPLRQQRLSELKNEEKRLRREADKNREDLRTAPSEEERKGLEAKERSTSRELGNVGKQIAALEGDMRKDQTEAHAARLQRMQNDIGCLSERQAALAKWLERIRKHDSAKALDIKHAVVLQGCPTPAAASSAVPRPAAPPAASASASSAAGTAGAAPAGLSATPDNQVEFHLRVPTLRILEQARILWALQKGEPPHWREADDALRSAIQERYNLRDSVVPAQGIYRVFAGMALFVSLVIPLMSLVFKLAGSKDIKTYYSLQAQASAGNPEALHVLESQQPALARASLRS